MRKRTLPLLLAGALACTSFAEVFWREKIDIPNGWERAYKSDAAFTQGAGQLELFASPTDLPLAAEELRQLHAGSITVKTGETAGWALAVHDGKVYRYFLQQNPGQTGTLITRVQQSEQDAGMPGESPVKHQLREIPAAPNSQPTYYLKDEGTRMAMEISTTTAPPSSVLETLTDSLTSSGWEETMPTSGHSRMFLKRERLAIITAKRSEDGFTRILRLHKPLGVK